MIDNIALHNKLYALKQRILLLLSYPNPKNIILVPMYNRASRAFVRIETIIADTYLGYLPQENQDKLLSLVGDERRPKTIAEADTLIAELIVWTMQAKHDLLERNLVVRDDTLDNVDPRSLT